MLAELRPYAEACSKWRGPSPRLSAWATQLRKNVGAVASRWRHCADLTARESNHKPPAPIAWALSN